MSIKTKTIYPGVRYREHTTRRHNGKPDRYFFVRYRLNKNLKEEGLGWASQGWNANKAALLLSKLKESHVSGDGPQTLADRRMERSKREEDILSFNNVFINRYFPHAMSNKNAESCRREQDLFRLRISPVIGNLSFNDITPAHLEIIKKNMSDCGLAPRSIRYALAVVRQVFNFARRNDIFSGESPTLKVKIPQGDNRRLRFLTHAEVDQLFSALSRADHQMYETALLSLHCGIRAGEIFSLTWGDVDVEKGILTLRDTKSGRTRTSFMTETVKSILSSKVRGSTDDLVFTNRHWKKITEVSRTFERIVKELGFNDGVTDRRQKVVFHSLRHTYASWLVESGVDLYTVKELLGHSTIALTERYSHLGNDTLQNAVKVLEKSITRKSNHSRAEKDDKKETPAI